MSPFFLGSVFQQNFSQELRSGSKRTQELLKNELTIRKSVIEVEKKGLTSFEINTFHCCSILDAFYLEDDFLG